MPKATAIIVYSTLERKMLVDGIYHKHIYLPDEVLIQVPTALRGVRWSAHAIQKAFENGIQLANRYNDLRVIEVEIKSANIRKAVYRHELYSWADLVFPVILERLFAPTVWLCQIYDAHLTLDESRYIRQ